MMSSLLVQQAVGSKVPQSKKATAEARQQTKGKQTNRATKKSTKQVQGMKKNKQGNTTRKLGEYL